MPRGSGPQDQAPSEFRIRDRYESELELYDEGRNSKHREADHKSRPHYVNNSSPATVAARLSRPGGGDERTATRLADAGLLSAWSFWDGPSSTQEARTLSCASSVRRSDRAFNSYMPRPSLPQQGVTSNSAKLSADLVLPLDACSSTVVTTFSSLHS